MTKKIIIEYDTKIGLVGALNRVLRVAEGGFPSTSMVHGQASPHLCWHTTFTDRTQVVTRQRRRPDAPDSVIVSMPFIEEKE